MGQAEGACHRPHKACCRLHLALYWDLDTCDLDVDLLIDIKLICELISDPPTLVALRDISSGK